MALLDTSRVEVSVSQCPEFLREGFLLLFPGESVEALSVMTITEHTHNDMTSWSSAVEAEREELAAHVRLTCIPSRSGAMLTACVHSLAVH